MAVVMFGLCMAVVMFAPCHLPCDLAGTQVGIQADLAVTGHPWATPAVIYKVAGFLVT